MQKNFRPSDQTDEEAQKSMLSQYAARGIMPQKLVYTNQEAMEMFGVSDKTLEKWRNHRLIGFSAVYKKIFYSPLDIIEFLEKNRVAPLD